MLTARAFNIRHSGFLMRFPISPRSWRFPVFDVVIIIQMEHQQLSPCATATTEHGLSLNKPALVNTCPHYALSCRQVVYVLDGHLHGSCQSCFDSILPKFHLQRRHEVPLQADRECFSCQSRPSRLNVDLAMGLCDRCYDHQMTQAAHYQAGRVVPLDQVPDELVARSLFIGAKETAANPDTLRDCNIKRVIVCCSTIPMYLPASSDVRYLRLPMADSLDQHILEYLPHALAFIDDGIRIGEATLVHCNAGVSRSGAVVVAWFMRTKNMSFVDALALAKTKRTIIHPNSSFVAQLTAASLSP